MDIDRDVLGWKGEELIPIPPVGLSCFGTDQKFPVLCIDRGGWARRQHREGLRQVLSRWERRVVIASATSESSHLLSPVSNLHSGFLGGRLVGRITRYGSRSAELHWAANANGTFRRPVLSR